VATKNTIHAVLNRSLQRYPGKFLFSKEGFRWLAELELPAAERMVLAHQATLLREVQARLDTVDRELTEQARLHPDAKLLVTIPGVDVVVAMGFLAAIESIERFSSPQKPAGYFGLVPKIRQSGGHSYHGHITKAGSRNARWLAIEAAHTIARSSSPLAASYHRVRRRKGHQVAVTALARKLRGRGLAHPHHPAALPLRGTRADADQAPPAAEARAPGAPSGRHPRGGLRRGRARAPPAVRRREEGREGEPGDDHAVPERARGAVSGGPTAGT